MKQIDEVYVDEQGLVIKTLCILVVNNSLSLNFTSTYWLDRHVRQFRKGGSYKPDWLYVSTSLKCQENGPYRSSFSQSSISTALKLRQLTSSHMLRTGFKKLSLYCSKGSQERGGLFSGFSFLTEGSAGLGAAAGGWLSLVSVTFSLGILTTP